MFFFQSCVFINIFAVSLKKIALQMDSRFRDGNEASAN